MTLAEDSKLTCLMLEQCGNLSLSLSLSRFLSISFFLSPSDVIIGFVMEQYTVFEGQVVSVCVSASMITVNQTVEVMVATQNDTASRKPRPV